LFPPEKLKDVITQVSNERLAICNECPEHSYNKENYKSVRIDAHCTMCGCTLSAKTKSFSSACPLEKWKAVMTQEQEKEIQQHGKRS
jgi:ribosomal protein L37E